MSEIILVALIGGGSALFGSLIGGIAVIATVIIQLKSQRKLEEDSRFFTARKNAYEKGLADISFAHGERLNGRRWPASSQDPENKKISDVLALISLYSSKELVSEIRKLFHYFDLEIPANPQVKLKEDVERIEIWKNVLRQMRKELGTGEFLEESIPDPPQDIK